jgi:ketosteroid isomerase-like protein
MTAKKLNPDLVRDEITRFWRAVTGKKSEELAAFYASECSVFGSMSRRPEPGRLAAARRSREYFGRLAKLRAEIGEIDVVMLGDAAAIATYTFEFHATGTSLRGQADEHIPHGRCSQVFGFDVEGKLKIFHEHMSAPVE